MGGAKKAFHPEERGSVFKNQELEIRNKESGSRFS
jgi:hypothetical protein